LKRSFYEYCLTERREELLQQWHPFKNVLQGPETLSYGSKSKVWWRCERGHEWQAAVYTRTGDGSGCPYCTGRLVLRGETDLASQTPEVAAQWHPVKNGDLLPQEVSCGSHKKVWWLCEKGHEWQAAIKTRSSGVGCPICKNRRLVKGKNDLATTHPALAAEWHPTKNGDLRPDQMVAGASRKVWWICEKGHEWQALVMARTSNGSGCPVCAGKVVIAGENDLASMFPELAAQWHPTKNDALTPWRVSPYSNRKVWWRCERGHEYSAVVSARTTSHSGCPYCAGRKVLAGFNDLETQAPEIAAQWYQELNGTLTPKQVTAGSRKKVWWQCPEGHVWKAVIYSRARGRKSGCPVCAGKVRPERQERYLAAMAMEKVSHPETGFDINFDEI